MDRILEVSCNGLTNGGVQQVIMNIVKNLSNEYKFDILLFTKGPEYYDKEFLKYGGKIYRIPHRDRVNGKEIDYYYRAWKIALGTYKILKKNGPYKAIHCHNYFEGAACLAAAKWAGVPIRISHSHNDMSVVKYSKTRQLINKFYKKMLCKYSTKRIGCSKKAIQYLFDGDGTVVNNAIDLNKFNPKKYKHSTSKECRLLHVGNFCGQKNQMYIVEVLKLLKENNINFHMNMVGGGDEKYKQAVLNKIQEYELDSFVDVLPHSADIPQIMNNSDLFVFPSLYEGLGIVLIEAQAMGLHCIVSEAVPKEADLGNLEYVNGSDIHMWADRITENIKSGCNRKIVGMKSYDISEISNVYRRLYL